MYYTMELDLLNYKEVGGVLYYERVSKRIVLIFLSSTSTHAASFADPQ